MTNKNSNSGYRNSGGYNSGSCNSGNCNSGNYNSGDYNSGNYNSGYRNSGNYNSGDYNSGDYNSGNYNSGYRNSGNYNSGNYNTGYCNTVTPEDTLIFNKPAKRKDWVNAPKPNWMQSAQLNKWVYAKDMTPKEKEAHPSYTTTGGYLKVYTSMQHAWIEAWEKADKEDREKTFNLPNFDAEVFKEIFGFNPVSKEETCEGKTVEIDGVKYRLVKEEK